MTCGVAARHFVNDEPGRESGCESSLLSSLLSSPVMSRAGGAGSQLQGNTPGRRCPAHYHIITLPGVWDWTLAMRLSQNALLLTNLTHLGTLILLKKKKKK